MARRKDEAEAAVVESVEDARALAKDVKERAARLKVVPGLLDGSLEDVRGEFERLLREYDKMTRRRLGQFQRDLELLARRIQDLEDGEHLFPKHARLAREALQHAKRIHFWNVRRAVERIDKILEPARACLRDAEAYRAFHRKGLQRVRDIEATLAKLREVPKPPAPPKAVERLREILTACDQVADAAWYRAITRAVAEMLKDLVNHPDVDGLGLLSTMEFACLRELSDMFEAQEALGQAIGTRSLSELVGTSEYSAAKWDRVFPEATPERHRLQELFHQLKPIVGGYRGALFGMDLSVPALKRRLAAWRQFPGVQDDPAWANLERLTDSGRIPSVQEAAILYDRYGDLGTRAFEGDLAEEIERQEKELAAAKKDLARLADPDSLLA